ncbi:MAG: hypothetical protein ACK57V_23750, partial [Pirellula sp.]
GRRAMNEGRTFSEADEHRDVKFWRQFKDDIVVELNTAVRIGLQHFESDLASCRKLSIELSQGFYKEGSPLIFESITEVTALADKLEYCLSEDPWISVKVGDTESRQTTWRHANEKRDYIRKGSSDGIYEIRKSRLHEYLSPSMLKEYLP